MGKRKKSSNNGLWIGIAVIIAIVVLVLIFSSKGTNPEEAGMQVILFDNQGNLIDSVDSLSIVQGVKGVASFAIRISVSNIGNQPLTCQLLSSDSTPVAFSTALTGLGTRTIPKTASGSWTSNLMTAAQFEGTTTSFATKVRCTYISGDGSTVTLGDKPGNISLTITSEDTGLFEVDVSSGLPSEFCGDNICQEWGAEDATTCPADCYVPPTVKFRTTSNLFYQSGTAIAFTETYGSDLTAYGYTGTTGTLTGDCATGSKSWCGTSPALKLSNLPGGWKTGGANPSLWKPTESNTYCVCDDGSDGKYTLRKYTTGSDYVGNVETSKETIDTTREVAW